MKRPWLLPLTPLWRAGVFLKNHAYERHLTPRRLTRPVISVGSLSAGGAGKTPVVIALAQLLARHNISADVLSRGYGRGSGAVEQVDPLGDPARFGDEPLEIAQTATPVFVGADRPAAGLLAESTLANQVHLLDDGFQHRRLARSLDLVLLTAEDLRDHLLPAGNLREPLSSLRRAQAVLLREEEAALLAPVVARHAPAAQSWVIQRNLHLLATDHQQAIAFCGLARPQNFFSQLRIAGCTLAGEIPFPDHYQYTSAGITALCRAAQHARARSFLTTAKDSVKLPPEFRTRLESVAPLHIAGLEVLFPDEAQVIASIAPLLNLCS